MAEKIEEQNEIITLSKLALELKIYRSTLDYYMSLDLIKPMNVIGATNVFNKQETIERIKKIKKLQENGNTLREIKELLEKK